MLKGPTWVVTADAGGARFYEMLRPGVTLRELEGLRLTGPQLTQPRDRPPRVHDRFGPARHAVEHRLSPKDIAEQHFLRQVALLLNDAAEKGAFDELILCAPPRALGLLQENLTAASRRRRIRVLPKDYTHDTPQALAEHLSESLH